jgi:hypothetical protein
MSGHRGSPRRAPRASLAACNPSRNPSSPLALGSSADRQPHCVPAPGEILRPKRSEGERERSRRRGSDSDAGMPAGTEATAVARPVKKAPAFGAVTAAPVCRRPLTRVPPASDTVPRKVSKPDGRDASAARFTRARSAASGCAIQQHGIALLPPIEGIQHNPQTTVDRPRSLVACLGRIWLAQLQIRGASRDTAKFN